MLKVLNGNISLTNRGEEIVKGPIKQRGNEISSIIFDLLLCEKLIDCNRITIDSITGNIRIPINAFSLSSALYRNYLYSTGSLSKSGSCFILVNSELREQIEEKIALENRRISQEELLKNLQKQQEDGEKGEIFVVDYEKTRLKSLIPKRISIVDAGAGYDILSCQEADSKEYDRYIEVKSFRGNHKFHNDTIGVFD